LTPKCNASFIAFSENRSHRTDLCERLVKVASGHEFLDFCVHYIEINAYVEKAAVNELVSMKDLVFLEEKFRLQHIVNDLDFFRRRNNRRT
jgi:hypothetical protein